MAVTNSSEIAAVLKERLRNELSGTVSNVLNKLLKSDEKRQENELLKEAVCEVTKTERYWKIRNNILLDSRRLHLDPTPVRSSYSYLPSEQIEELGELLYHPDLELRLKSLDYLLRCVSNETLLQLPGWKRLENGLRLNVLNDVTVLSEVSFQVYNKFLNSTDSRLVCEIYFSLLKTMAVRFENPDGNPRIRIVTGLVNFIKSVPQRWIRFPDSAIDAIVCETIASLDSCAWASCDDGIGLGHTFGQVDPRGDWIKSLLLGAPVRLKVFNYLSERNSFVEKAVNLVLIGDVDTYELIESVSLLCRLFETKGGHLIIDRIVNPANTCWFIWSRIVILVALQNVIPSNEFFSIECILERNGDFTKDVVEPFLSDLQQYGDHIFSLIYLKRALGTSQALTIVKDPLFQKLTLDHLVRLDSNSNPLAVSLILEISFFLIRETFSTNINFDFLPSVFQMLSCDSTRNRVLEFLGKISCTPLGFKEMRNSGFSQNEIYLDYLKSILEDDCNFCYLNFLSENFQLSSAVNCLSESGPVLLESVWNRVECFCDKQNRDILNYLERVYSHLVPFYPQILRHYSSTEDIDFHNLVLLIDPRIVEDRLPCQECYRLISLRIYELVFMSLRNINFFVTKFNIRSFFKAKDVETLFTDEISILSEHILRQTGTLGFERILTPYQVSVEEAGNCSLPDMNEFAPQVTEFNDDLELLDPEELLSKFANYLRQNKPKLMVARKFWTVLIAIECPSPKYEVDETYELEHITKMFVQYELEHKWLSNEVEHVKNIINLVPHNVNVYVFLIAYLIADGQRETTYSVYFLAEKMQFNNDDIMSRLLHYFDVVVGKEAPEVRCAFKLANFRPSDVMRHWLNQFYWNVFNMLDIIGVLLTCVVKGVQELVYWGVVTLKHFEKEILSLSREDKLNVYFVELSSDRLNLSAYLDTVENLRQKYDQEIGFIQKTVQKYTE